MRLLPSPVPCHEEHMANLSHFSSGWQLGMVANNMYRVLLLQGVGFAMRWKMDDGSKASPTRMQVG